jgi:hypothetical protein
VEQSTEMVNNKKSRSLDSSSNELNSLSNEHTLSNRISEEKSDLHDKIRLESLGLVLKNLFNDIIIRPFMYALKFARTTRDVFQGEV